MNRLVLGIDPGSQATGWGLVRGAVGKQPTFVDAGTIRPPKKTGFEARLMYVYSALIEVFEKYSPHEVAVEDVFYAKNVKSALKLGHVRGVALLAAAKAGRPVFSYSPARIKQAVTGTGRADKSQVTKMVTILLGLDKPPQADAADALAVAVCHAHSVGTFGENL